MVMFGLPMWMVLIFLFMLGAVIGSFLNVCIHRIPMHERTLDAWRGLSHPPSRCPNCLTPIRAYDNIPILGWLLLRGRCRTCKQAISFRYPAIELFNALLFVLVYWLEVPSGYGLGIQASSVYDPLGPTGNWGSWLTPVMLVNLRYAYHMVLIETLVAATFIDFDLRIIPDAVTLPAMGAGIFGAWAIGQLYIVPLWFQGRDWIHLVSGLYTINGHPPPHWLQQQLLFSNEMVPAWIPAFPHTHGLLASLAGFLVGGGVVWLVRIIGQWVLRQEAMGFGDVILMATIGSFLGWQPTLVVFFLAPVCALVVVAGTFLFARQREIPYGPYLSLATLIVICCWRQIGPAATRIFELGPLIPVMAALMTVLLVVSLQLVQGVKRLLGFELYPQDFIEEWTSGDQLTYLAGEWVDPEQGQWRREHWQGLRSGTGQAPYNDWRREPPMQSAAGWRQHWQRRNGSR